MNEFKTYHPIVNFIYFLLVIGCSMFFMHPVCLGISLLCAFLYCAVLKGRKAVRTNLVYLLPMMLMAALLNPAFNHEGVTILTYLPTGNPLTLESISYGIAAAVMLMSVLCWFSCYNEIMTGDKFIYLFGRIIPSLSLIISMTLRFVSKFTAQLRVVSNAQRCIGRDVSAGSVRKRVKNGISILSVMITWALEHSIETADSMKSRGYGLPGRTAFSVFIFDKRDRNILICVMLLGLYVLCGSFLGGISFRYFPSMKWAEVSVYGVTVLLAYFLLCILPVIIEIWEVAKWKSIKSKM